ncbi:MAG: DUF4129 domain-containing protein [Saprospiraceae bacterium]|nr:DUF4129 domain-containing protein [Saprospiraceae bacterium]
MNGQSYISFQWAKAIPYVLLLLSCFNTSLLLGQADDNNSYLQEDRSTSLISDQEWEKWSEKRADSKYWEKIQAAEKEGKKEEEEPAAEFDPSLIKAFATFLLIIIGIIVAFFVVRQLMGLQIRPRNRKIKRQGDLTIDLEEIEDKLEEVVLEDFIQEAIQNGNFALAIRLYYLEALKSLSLQQQIKWKKDKTNRDYLLEMSNSPFYHSFQEITRLFERVWYGNRTIDAAIFHDIAPTFRKFITEVSTKNLTTTPS